jgi:N-acetylglutamate synthase/N-acetylornithine aminotransferase
MDLANELTKETTKQSMWVQAWREIATASCGITGNHPRLQSVVAGLDACREAERANDWSAFERAADRVKAIAKGQSS